MTRLPTFALIAYALLAAHVTMGGKSGDVSGRVRPCFHRLL